MSVFDTHTATMGMEEPLVYRDRGPPIPRAAVLRDKANGARF